MAHQPLLIIKSNVWFPWLARRAFEIEKTQRILETRRPENYGILTGLLTHMLRSVVSTPMEVPSFVNESLALLNTRQLVDRFGMLFLHNLNLKRENPLEDVQEQDDLGVLKAIGVADHLKKRKPRLPTPAPDDPDVFPIGHSPTWKEIVKCFQESPWLLMKAWTWREEWSQMNNHAVKLFILCTNHVWMSLNVTLLVDGIPPISTTLQEAMESWTIQSVHSTIRSVQFIPCNAGLEGSIPGRRVKNLQERRPVYFPRNLAFEHPTSVWQALCSQPGYIFEYQEIIKKLNTPARENLDLALDTLLSHIHCFPNGFHGSKNSKTRGTIWTWSRSSVVEVITNPRFYKLARVGNAGRKKSQTSRKAPLHQSVKNLQISLVEHSGFGPKVAKQAVNWKRRYDKKHRSSKAKGKRVPPRKKKKPEVDEGEDAGGSGTGSPCGLGGSGEGGQNVLPWHADLDNDIDTGDDGHNEDDDDSGNDDEDDGDGEDGEDDKEPSEDDLEDLYW
jgi:hypothetical protein